MVLEGCFEVGVAVGQGFLVRRDEHKTGYGERCALSDDVS